MLVRSVDDELVLLNLDNEEYYGLDEVGTAIWNAVTKYPDLESALEELGEDFDVDRATLERDVNALLERLSERGLVERDRS